MENLLYYPYINIPNTNWTVRTLLYYDRIGSIVPQRYLYDQYDPHMKALVDNQLLEPINPMTVLNRPHAVFRPLLSYFESPAFQEKKRRANFRLRPQKNPGNNRYQLKLPPTRIHSDKFDHEVFRALIDMDRAIREDEEWYLVEKTTADDLMTFLASVLGQKINYQPTTDQEPRYFRLAVQKKEFAMMKKVDRKRLQILNDLIPFPEEIELSKLRHFKDRHHDLLKAFKNRVELIALDPSIDIDSPLFLERVKELRIRKEELTAKMSEKKIGRIIFGSVYGVLGGTAAFASPAPALGIGLSMAGFASAVYTALQIETPEKIVDQSGLKFLALIDKRHRPPIHTRQ